MQLEKSQGVYRRADHGVPWADRSGRGERQDDPASLPGDRDLAAELWPLTQGVRRCAARSSQGAEGTGAGEHPAEEAGG
jgi:hypothetical protein